MRCGFLSTVKTPEFKTRVGVFYRQFRMRVRERAL